MTPPIERLEEKLGYQFKNRELLFCALTHRSCASEFPPDECADNEQFEFLGDSVLGFVVSEALVARYPEAREGELSQWKSHLVSAAYLYHCALAITLGEYLRLGKGEERNGGRERKTVLANAFEAVIAAIHLDGGIDVARQFITRHVLFEIDTMAGGSIELSITKASCRSAPSPWASYAALLNRSHHRARARQSLHRRSPCRRRLQRTRHRLLQKSRQPASRRNANRPPQAYE